jgi:hypothetical protein
MGGGSSSASPSPNHSPVLSAIAHPHPQHPGSHSGFDVSSLAPPPPAPHGPRSPAQASTHSRTPSPSTPNLDPYVMGSSGVSAFDLQNGMDAMHLHTDMSRSSSAAYEDDGRSYIKPSAKALGKRKVVEEEPPEGRLLLVLPIR